MKAMCKLLFFGLVRSSTLVPGFPGETDPRRQITWDRVKRLGELGAVLEVILDKTIQTLDRVHYVSLAARPGSIYCPVAALDELLQLQGGSPNCGMNQLVLRLPLGNGKWRPLVKYEFVAWFRKRLTDMGVDPEMTFVHGFRHGGISLCMKEEQNLALVKISSNHLSDAIFSYSFLPPEDRLQVCRKMLAAMPRL